MTNIVQQRFTRHVMLSVINILLHITTKAHCLKANLLFIVHWTGKFWVGDNRQIVSRGSSTSPETSLVQRVEG